MMRQIKNKNRLIVELVFVIMCVVAALTYINHTRMHTELQLVLNLKISHYEKVKLQLFTAGKMPVEKRFRPKVRFKKVHFNLPRKLVKNLRLSLGELPGTVAIQSITISSLAKSYTLKGKRIYKLFKRTHLTDKPYVEDNIFYVTVNGPGNWIAPGPPFYNIVDELSAAKFLSYIIVLLLGLVLFYVIHNVDPRNLKIFFSLKIVTNGVLVFLLIISFPLLNKLLNLDIESQLVERRTMTREPEFRLDSLFSFPKKYTSYYNDHFALRGTLIYYRNLLKYKLFNISATEKVLIGKNNWLFFGDYEERVGTIDYYRSVTPLTLKQLESWHNLLESRRKWLAKRGIHYLFVIAPNKNTIYPEYMPDQIRKVNTRSRLDQLYTFLKKHSHIPVLDLRSPLIAGKKKWPVYSRTDSHWNEYGAYIAYREILTFIRRFPEFENASPVPLSQYQIAPFNKPGGDMAEMLSLHKEIMREDMIKLTPLTEDRYTGGQLPRISPFVKQGYTKNPYAQLPPILMVHDSFYKKLKPFLSEQFSKIHYIWDWDLNFYPDIIKKEKPKLVIDEMAERFLMNPPPTEPSDNTPH